MARILCIETATPVCSVALVENDIILSYKETNEKNSHSEVLTVFIEEIMKEAGLNFSDLEAVAVSKGPGSYTGLRIGVSTAKGLCYALNVPLIAINTLRSMAMGVAEKYENNLSAFTLCCPMIDARRMEVYSALFDINNKEIRETRAEIILEGSFSEYFIKNKLVFFGDGAQKCKTVISHPNAVFIDNFTPSAVYMSKIASEKFRNNDFEDLAYFEPFYLKDFVAGIPKVKGLK